MNIFTIFRATSCQKSNEINFSIRCEIRNLNDLLKTAAFDHVSVELQGSQRNDVNFISSNVLTVDIDNNHSDDPDAWVTPDDMADAFPDVQFYYIHSRNNMKPKDGKEPRPKNHFYFPLSRLLTKREELVLYKKMQGCMFPFCDPALFTASQPLFGVPEASGGEIDGDITIDQYIDSFPDRDREMRKSVEAYCRHIESDGWEDIKKLREFVGVELPTGHLITQPDVSQDATQPPVSWGKFHLPDVIPQGQRQDVLIALIGSMSARGNSGAEIVNRIRQVNEKLCKPPMEEDELIREIFPAIPRYTEHDTAERAAKALANGNSTDDGDLTRFHRFNKDNRAVDIIDAEIVSDILEKHRIIVLAGEPYIYKNGVYQYDRNGVFVKKEIKNRMFRDILNINRVERVYRLLLIDEGIQEDIENPKTLNRHPQTWINCQNGMLDTLTMELHPHSPDYFSINQVPFSFNPEWRQPSDSITAEFLEAFLPDQGDRQMFLEYTGYCLTASTRFQKYLIMTGEGGIGKSILMKMVSNIVGSENISTITLQALSGRFSTRFLFGKLLNSYADLSSASMDDTANLKLIVGQDDVPAEIKGGASFHFRPYCKLLFSANRVPANKDEQSVAFYRRLLILAIEKRCRNFPDLEERLEADAETFFYLAVRAVHEAFKRGELAESQHSRDEVLDLYLRTDTVKAWMHYQTEAVADGRLLTTEAYKNYRDYCLNEERSYLSRNGFRSNLKEKGVSIIKLHGYDYFEGIKLIETEFTQSETSFPNAD